MVRRVPDHAQGDQRVHHVRAEAARQGADGDHTRLSLVWVSSWFFWLHIAVLDWSSSPRDLVLIYYNAVATYLILSTTELLNFSKIFP